jgi:hypothetical protein
MLKAKEALESLLHLQSRMSDLWLRDNNTIDIFMDFEFWDRGAIGTHFISSGLVLVAGNNNPEQKNSNYRTKLFYGVNTEFFARPECFTAITKNFRDGDENAKWLNENVFNQINGYLLDVDGERLQKHNKIKPMSWHQSSTGLADLPALLPVLDETLGDEVVQCVGTLKGIRNKLIETVDSFGIKKPKIRTWGYYNAHDHVCLSQLFGVMVDMPDNWNFYDYDLRALTDVFGYDHDDFNPEPTKPHHALHDAYAQYVTTQRMCLELVNDNLLDLPEEYRF